jgi:tetratricopeptide (TPR) repeat protein
MIHLGQPERESPKDAERPQVAPLGSPRRRLRWSLALEVLAACALVGVLAVLVGQAWTPHGLLGRGANKARSKMPPLSDPESQALREEAFEAAERLVEKYPRDPDAVYSKAGVRNRFGDSEEAVVGWKRCLKLDPQFALAYYCLGWNALNCGELDESVEFLRKALELDPKMGHAHLLLAEALMDLGKMAAAAEPLETHLRLVPRSVEGHYRLGQVYVHAKQYQRAKQYFLAALEIDANCGPASEGLAKVYDGLDDRQQAEEYRKKLAELKEKGIQGTRPRRQPVDLDQAQVVAGAAFAHTDVGRVYGARGDWAEAVKHWRRAAELAPRDTEPRILLVSIYQQFKRYPEALVFLRELASIEPTNAVHQINIGVLASELGRFDEAEKAFQRVQELIPFRHEGYAGLARLYLDANRNIPEADKLTQKAVELAPVAANYYLLGLAQSRSGRRQKALESLKRATELDRGNMLYAKAYAELSKDHP